MQAIRRPIFKTAGKQFLFSSQLLSTDWNFYIIMNCELGETKVVVFWNSLSENELQSWKENGDFPIEVKWDGI